MQRLPDLRWQSKMKLAAAAHRRFDPGLLRLASGISKKRNRDTENEGETIKVNLSKPMRAPDCFARSAVSQYR